MNWTVLIISIILCVLLIIGGIVYGVGKSYEQSDRSKSSSLERSGMITMITSGVLLFVFLLAYWMYYTYSTGSKYDDDRSIGYKYD